MSNKTAIILIVVFLSVAWVLMDFKHKIESLENIMEPNWGLLEKSQSDDETIEEAISRLITAHNDDADAHIGTGKSLDTHKTQTTVDHPADSIVEDKILANVVSVEKRKWNNFVLETIFESLDSWNQTTTGSAVISLYPGSVYLYTGGTSNSEARIQLESYSEGWGVNFEKNPRFMTQVVVYGNSNQEVEIIAGDQFCGFGFKLEGSTIYAFHRKDVDEVPTDYTTEIKEATGVWEKLEAIYTTGSKIEFYVNGVLVATHTSNLPEDGDTPEGVDFMKYRIKTTEASSKTMYIRNLNFTQDE